MPESSNVGTSLEAWLLLWACRAGLWFAPFQRVLRGVEACAARFRSSRTLTPEETVRGIERALPFTWHCSCLTQALAGWIMLSRRGMVVQARIGVSTAAQSGFKAHAWLERDGAVFLGGPEDGHSDGILPEACNVIWTLPAEQAH